MAEELLEIENTIEDEAGRSHIATVLGAEREDGKWIGWIRFQAPDGEILETERETTQPNRTDLVYWSTGLTYFYLEGALERARRRRDMTSDMAPRASPPAPSPEGVPCLEVRSVSADLVDTVMGVRAARPGTARQVPDAGVVVYEGSQTDDDGTRHLFAVQFGSENAGAILANWLWSRLHGTGAEVRVDGAPVEIRNDALKRALVGR